MCGIAGIYHYQDVDPSSSEISIKGMLSAIRHRGPDESGAYLGKNLAFGAVRLSIQDIEGGHQPMCDASENFWIVYNGEIFNYEELRKLIEEKGISLRTKCDTEIVVQMYALFGSECLKYFNGQFAFCIYNKKNKELFFARDRVGIRPLFYSAMKESFAFCSEIKGIFTLSEVKKEIRSESLAQIFTFWTTISPFTPFENVYELPPGHFMVVNSSNIQIEKYWSINFPTKGIYQSGNFHEMAEELNYLLKDAVKIRLKADVPVGAYLSGGLDSSMTTAYINEINPAVLNTFSIGFTDAEYDETAYQLEAAEYFKTNHTHFTCSSEEIAEQFANTIWHTEFPILRTAPTPMFMLSRKVHERNIKVVITGEGADEILGGYNIFKESKIRRFWANQPDSSLRPKLLSKLYPYLTNLKGHNNMAAKMFFGYKLTDTDNPLYSHLIRWHNTSRIKSFFSEELTKKLKDYNPIEEIHPELPVNFMEWSDLAKSQFLETYIFMSGYLLSSQGDRMAMANSVEGRYPFLDFRVIEFCAQLSDNYKLNGLNEKYILKKISEGKIPNSITNRSKQPYRAPIAGSFFCKNSPEYISEILSENNLKLYGLFNPEKVKQLINKIKLQEITSEIDQMAIAGIVSTQLLYKIFISESIKINFDNLENIKIIKEEQSCY